MQRLDKDISEQYMIKIKSVVPFRDGYIIETSKGKKILKVCKFSPQRVLFIHGVKEHLHTNGFNNIDRYLCTWEGSPYIVINHECYTLSDMAEGKALNMDSEKEVRDAAKLLASVHNASRGYIPPQGCIVKDKLGKLPEQLQKRMHEIRRLKKYAEKRKTGFDNIFMEKVDYFNYMAEKSLDRLSKSSYNDLVIEAKKNGVVCHQDFTQYNVINCRDQLYVINFDYCCFELKMHDLANFIRRKMRKCGWDINKAEAILKQYTTVEDLSHEEMEIIIILIMFPQKFWRISNRYYNSKRIQAGKNFLMRIKEATDEIECQEEFIKSFEQMLLNA